MQRATLFICALLVLMTVAASCGDDDPVAVPNNDPVMQAQSDTTASPGDTLVLWAVAQDEDNDRLKYGLTVFVSLGQILVGDIPDTDFDGETGRFEFRVQSTDEPERGFAFTVDDGRGGTASTAFTVTVQ